MGIDRKWMYYDPSARCQFGVSGLGFWIQELNAAAEDTGQMPSRRWWRKAGRPMGRSPYRCLGTQEGFGAELQERSVFQARTASF